MAWTQADLNRIDSAIAAGAKTVKYADKTIEYHSMSDMIRARELISNELGLNKNVSRVTVAQFDRGRG